MKTEVEKDAMNTAVASQLTKTVVDQYSRDANLALALVENTEYKFRLEFLSSSGIWAAVVKGVMRGNEEVAVAITEAWLAYMNKDDEGIWIEVESSNVGALREINGDLHVRFLNGSVYRYKGVPTDVVEAMKTSESVGRFLNKEIKPTYECEKVEA